MSTALINDTLRNNNSGVQMTDSVEDQVQFFMYGIVFPLIVPIGLFFNICSFIVLTRTSMLSSINIYLAGLSLFDSLLLFFTLLLFPPFSYCERSLYSGVESTAGSDRSFWCVYFFSTGSVLFPLSCTAQTGSVWTMVAISVDRFIAIRWPLKARDVLTDEKAKFFVTVIGVGSILYNIPIYFELEQDETGMLRATKFRDSSEYITIYKGYCYLIFMFVGPALVTLLLNLIVTKSVRTAFKIRRRLSGREEKERRCTMTAVLVVGVFLLLNLLAIINNFFEAMRIPFAKNLTVTGNFLVMINSVANFVIYYAMGLKFRRMFCKIFCRNCCCNRLMLDSKTSIDQAQRSSYYGSFRHYNILNQRTNSTIERHKDSNTKEPLTPANKCKISPSVRHRPQNGVDARRNGAAADFLNAPNTSSTTSAKAIDDSSLLHLRPLAPQQPQVLAPNSSLYPKHFYLAVNDGSGATLSGTNEGAVASPAQRKISRSLNAFPQLATNNKIQDTSVATTVVKRWSYNEDKRRNEDPAQGVAFLDDNLS